MSTPQELFDKFYPARLGASFKLLGYCSQVVNGVNYSLEIEETLTTNPPKKSVIYHYFYVDSNGKIEDKGVKDHPPQSTENIGGWHCEKV